jgi:hypothetical protein
LATFWPAGSSSRVRPARGTANSKKQSAIGSAGHTGGTGGGATLGTGATPFGSQTRGNRTTQPTTGTMLTIRNSGGNSVGSPAAIPHLSTSASSGMAGSLSPVNGHHHNPMVATDESPSHAVDNTTSAIDNKSPSIRTRHSSRVPPGTSNNQLSPVHTTTSIATTTTHMSRNNSSPNAGTDPLTIPTTATIPPAAVVAAAAMDTNDSLAPPRQAW